MNNQVLVTCASKYGATAEVAKKIAELLRQAGLSADVIPVIEARHIQSRDITLFHGELDPEKVNFIERSKIKNVESPVGDFRDWDAITRPGPFPSPMP